MGSRLNRVGGKVVRPSPPIAPFKYLPPLPWTEGADHGGHTCTRPLPSPPPLAPAHFQPTLTPAHPPLTFGTPPSSRQVLVVLRAALKDTQARLGVYVKFLTAATSAWTAWVYGIQVGGGWVGGGG